MRLFFTGKCPGQPSSKDKSLGGWLSTTVVPNGVLDVLFEKFAYSTISKSQCKGVILKNEIGDLTTVTIKCIPPITTLYDLKVAIVSPAISSKGVYIEEITNIYSLPYLGNFVSFTTPVPLGNLSNGAYLGFWFKLSLKENPFLGDLCSITSPSSGTQENWEIKFEWN